MVVEGESYPDDYRVYGDTIYNVSIKQEKVPNKLTGKTVVFTGDSICHAASEIGGGWAKRIGEKNNMVWSNQGINGRTITKGVNETSICETDFGENPDYIILEGGTNDADKFLNSPEKFGSYSPHDYVSDFEEAYSIEEMDEDYEFEDEYIEKAEKNLKEVVEQAEAELDEAIKTTEAEVQKALEEAEAELEAVEF
jgi:lysophospholipase L1-like esterase